MKARCCSTSLVRRAAKPSVSSIGSHGIIFAVVVVLILMRLHNPPDGENQLSWELWKLGA